MKDYMITVDAGTTNTRVLLLDDKHSVKGIYRAEVGVRNTAIDGNNSRLKQSVKEGIEHVMREAGVSWEQIEQILASGMITSNVGLVEIPHIVAPAGAVELAAGAREILLEDVCPLPITFIPGVKNDVSQVDSQNFEAMDIMRGEEVETIAMLHHLPKGKPYLMVLPGSHTKLVSVDSEGRIVGCLTSMTGELLAVVTNNTVIADAVGHSFVGEEDYDKEYLLNGYETAKETGMGRACFAARILNMFVEKDRKKIANYILGVVLQNDIQMIHRSSALCVEADTVVAVGGKNPLRQALMDLLAEDGTFSSVEEITAQGELPLSAEGVCIVAKYRK